MTRGQALMQRRAELGLTRAALARKAGVPELLIERLERGDGAVQITVEHAQQLADTAGLSFDTVAGIETRHVSALNEGRDDRHSDCSALLGVLSECTEPSGIDAVAWGLGWTLPRLEAALVAAHQQLEGTGLTVRHAPEDQLVLGSQRPEGSCSVARRIRQKARQSYSPDEVRVLVAIAELDERSHPCSFNEFDTADQGLVQDLAREGLVVFSVGNILGLSDEARTALAPAFSIRTSIQWQARQHFNTEDRGRT